MNLALAIKIMDHVAENDGDLPFDSDDLSYRWYDAWRYFKRRPRQRKAYEERLLGAPINGPVLADVKPFMIDLVAVFRLLNTWYEEATR